MPGVEFFARIFIIFALEQENFSIGAGKFYGFDTEVVNGWRFLKAA